MELFLTIVGAIVVAWLLITIVIPVLIVSFREIAGLIGMVISGLVLLVIFIIGGVELYDYLSTAPTQELIAELEALLLILAGVAVVGGPIAVYTLWREKSANREREKVRKSYEDE